MDFDKRKEGIPRRAVKLIPAICLKLRQETGIYGTESQLIVIAPHLVRVFPHFLLQLHKGAFL